MLVKLNRLGDVKNVAVEVIVDTDMMERVAMGPSVVF